MDGKFTLNENVCDIDGLNVASKAFSDLREASANDLVHLPNNPYTPQQLFFINTAQVIFLCIQQYGQSQSEKKVNTYFSTSTPTVSKYKLRGPKSASWVCTLMLW